MSAKRDSKDGKCYKCGKTEGTFQKKKKGFICNECLKNVLKDRSKKAHKITLGFLIIVVIVFAVNIIALIMYPNIILIITSLSLFLTALNSFVFYKQNSFEEN